MISDSLSGVMGSSRKISVSTNRYCTMRCTGHGTQREIQHLGPDATCITNPGKAIIQTFMNMDFERAPFCGASCIFFIILNWSRASWGPPPRVYCKIKRVNASWRLFSTFEAGYNATNALGEQVGENNVTPRCMPWSCWQVVLCIQAIGLKSGLRRSMQHTLGNS